MFLVLFLASLVLLRVNNTVLSADFYVEQLQRADIFSFLYNDVAPVALREASNEPGNLSINVEKVGSKAIALVKEVLPPKWLEEQAEQEIAQVVPYLVGDNNQFTVSVPVADRIETLGEVLRRELGGGETYTMLFDDVIAPALKDALEDNPELGDLPLGITVTSEDLVAAVREMLPPEWARARVGEVVDQVVPYLTGESEHFAINIPVGDRIEAAGPTLKKLLTIIKAYQVLNSPEFADAVDKQLKDFGALPLGIKLTNAQIVKALQQVAPPEWLQLWTEAFLDATIPYLLGKQEHFEIAVPLKDRVQVALPVVKGLMRDADACKLLFDQLIVTMVRDNLGQAANLPVGITVTAEDVVPLLRKTLSPEFIQQQTENMLDQLAPYLTGESQGLRLVVPLADRKAAALVAVQELVDKKLNELVASMRPCTVTKALDLVKTGFAGALPPCLPKGYTLEQIKQALGINIPGISLAQIEQQLGISLTIVTQGVTAETIKTTFGIDIAGQVGKVIGDALPNEYVFTDVDLRGVLGDKHKETLDKVLGWTRNGYIITDTDLRGRLNDEQQKTWDRILDVTRNGVTYTDVDLRNTLAKADLDVLDQVLERTRNGVAFTEADLRKAIADAQGGQEALNTFDLVRKYMGLGRKLSFLLYLVPALLLAAIGFLGGRSWRGRLAWAAVPLLFGAGIAYAASGPVYSAIAQPMLDDAFANAKGDATGVALMMVEKGTSVAQAAINDFISLLATQSLVLLIISAVALAVAILWPILFRRPRATDTRP